MYVQKYDKSIDQPDKVVNPARAAGQLNTEISISLSSFAPEKLVLRDGFGSSPVPRQPAHLHNLLRVKRASLILMGIFFSTAYKKNVSARVPTTSKQFYEGDIIGQRQQYVMFPFGRLL